MDNVLFTITVDNTLTAWAPINSWEPHIIYQRASISMHSPQFKDLSSMASPSCFWILVDNSELTRALETVFNKSDHEKYPMADELDTITDLARKSPEVCLALDQTGDRLLVWGIDVTVHVIDRANSPSSWIRRPVNQSVHFRYLSALSLPGGLVESPHIHYFGLSVSELMASPVSESPISTLMYRSLDHPKHTRRPSTCFRGRRDRYLSTEHKKAGPPSNRLVGPREIRRNVVKNCRWPRPPLTGTGRRFNCVGSRSSGNDP